MNVVSTALLYEIIVAERLDLARVVVASSQSAMGEGLYRCPVDGEQVPGMRPESALAAGQWDIPCPECGGPLEMQATPERISNPQNAYGMSKLGQEMVAINLGRRYGIPTVALRYSIVQGPRQSVYNAYSGACRIFCLQLSARAWRRPSTRTAGRSATTSTSMTWWTPTCSSWQDDRAVGRVFNVGGGRAVTTREFADIVMRHYGSDQPGVVTGEYRFGDTRHILSDISALRVAGLGTAAHAGRLGGRVCRLARGHGRSRRRARRGQRAHARPRGGPEGGGVKAFLLAAGVGSRLRPITDTTPKCMLVIDGRPLLDIWLDAFDRAGVDEVLVNLHHLPDVVRSTLPRGPGRRRSALSSSRNCSAAPVRSPPTGTGSTMKRCSWPATPTTSRISTCGHSSTFIVSSGAVATLAVFHSEQPSAGGVVELDDSRHGRRFRGEAQRAGFRPGERRHVRLPSRRAR